MFASVNPLIALTLDGDGVPLPACLGTMVTVKSATGRSSAPSANDAIPPDAVATMGGATTYVSGRSGNCIVLRGIEAMCYPPNAVILDASSLIAATRELFAVVLREDRFPISDSG